MSTLVKCLGRMSKVISAEEAQEIQRIATAYAQAMPPSGEAKVIDAQRQASEERAVQEVIDGLMEDLSKILSQVTIPEVKALPLPYGAIIQGFPSEDMRDSNVSPVELEDKVRKNITGKQVVLGDKSGSRSVTSIGMVWQDKDGKVVLTGITTPPQILRVAGGKQMFPAPIAVQRMGTDTREGRKNKRAVAVGGEEPVLLREVAEHGFKPIAIIHFTGEPARIFQEFPNLAAFDKAYATTPSTVGTGRQGAEAALPPRLEQGARQAANQLQQIEAEIDTLGRQVIEAHDAKDFGRVDELNVKLKELFKRQAKILKSGQDQVGDAPIDKIPELQTQRLRSVPVVDQSRTAIDAQRTQEFVAVMNRMRAQGMNVDVLTREIFQQGVAQEIQNQIDQLNARLEQATGAGRTAIERQIQLRQDRLLEVMDAQGATFSPYHIALAVDDVSNATLANLITLLHEAAEAQTMGMTPMDKGAVSRAIAASLTEIRAKTQAAADRTGAPVASEQGGLFDILAESLAQQLAAEGIPDSPSLAKAIWRFVKDLYFRAAMAVQRAFGVEPSHKLVLDWYENQLRRTIGGDFDWRLGSLTTRFLPETMEQRASRFPRRSGTPGGVSDYFNGATGKLEQPGVLPDSAEAIAWNIEFQTVPPQTSGGEAIQGPEARARIEAAAQRQYIVELEKVKEAGGAELLWGDWWKAIGSGEDPKVSLAEMESKDSTLTTAAINGPRMSQYMNGLASLKVRQLLENLEVKVTERTASSNEAIDAEADKATLLAKEVNRLESDRRNAELHEATLQEKLKKLVQSFVADQNNGYITAEQYGALSEAVATAERLLEGETIPEQYQQVFKAIMDGTVPVFDYVKAIAKLDLDLSSMTPEQVGKAIVDNADSSATLRKLSENKPLWVAMSVLAVKNAAQFDEIALGYIDSQLEYASIHKELQTIRTANAEQLREMILTMKEQVKGAGLRERAKRAYITRRRELQVARNRIGLAQARVEVATGSLAALHDAVERSQQTGSEAPSEWFPVSGAQFIEKRPGEAGWSSRSRTLAFRPDGSLVDGDAVRKALALNHAWLKAKVAKAGSREYELVKRQTHELGMLDVQAKYRNAHARKIDTFLAPLAAQAMRLGGGGERAAQMLQRFQAIRFQHSQQVGINAHAWSFAWQKLAKLTGIHDVGILRDKLYDPLSYFLNTEPGLEQDAALRQAVKMARARLSKPAPEGFDAAVKELLTATKTGFEYLVKQATEYGAYVEDSKLKSGLRKAIAQGWLTSMRSIDGGLVSRITSDMDKAGWKLEIQYLRDAQGNVTNKRASTKATTFADLTSTDTEDTETLDAALQPLFTSGIIRDWLLPFIRKGGNEVFRYSKNDIPQLALQQAWQGADGNVLRWIDNLAETMELPDAEPATEDGPGTNPLADFRLSMLKQLDGLFGMESRLAYEANQTRNLFDPMGPKPHVMMDARLDDRLPHEHLDFAFLDPHTSQMLLAEIAFHASFGRNGERMSQTVSEMQARADRAHVDYAALTGTTHNARVAEALVRGWKDFAELENLASRAKDIKRWQGDLESFMSVGRVGGPFEQVRAGMSAINFMAGQIVDNPKTAFYNMLSPAQLPFATHSLGPKTLRTVADAYLKIFKTGIGTILEAMHLHLMHASEQERWITEAMGASRNQSWRQAVSDIGPGGSQTTTDKWFIKPLTFIRYVQNKGANIPLQGEAREFPRLAVIPGLGVSNSLAQITAVGGMSAQIGMFQRMIQAGATYLSAHREAAQDPSFRFKAADLGMGRSEKGLFDWWRAKSVEYRLGTLEDVVRGAMPAMARGERMLTREQVLNLAQMASTEINGDASVNTTPGMMISSPWLRVAFPLLRWPLWAMDKAHEGLRNVDGTYTPASVAKGLAILAAWNLPIGLAFTFLIDEYDEEILGKKSNLPSVGKVAALPFVGPAAEAIMSDRSIPDTVKAYFVRAARAGNIYGLGADFAAQIAAPTDATSGRRIFSLDQRILVMSQLLNAQQALSNVLHQETATWASVWAPLIRSVGGNGAIHVLDVTNNVLELDNAESRNVMRINAGNWIRAAASELKMEVRAGGSGTPTPMSVWTREQFAAAIADDRVGFMEAYRKALEAARKTVASDPTVPLSEKEIEAGRRVLAGWRSRDPLSILARKPTPMEVRRMLAIMDPDGARDVAEAINRYNKYTKLITPSPMESQMRAEIRRMTTPPNPFRSRAVPVY